MILTVKLFATLRIQLGVAELKFELDKPIAIIELINLISEKVGTDISVKLIEGDKIKIGTIILIDGKNVIHMNGLDTVIENDSLISVFPPAAGG